MKKIFAILLAVGMIAALFVGCAGSNPTTGTDAPETEAPQSETEANPAAIASPADADTPTDAPENTTEPAETAPTAAPANLAEIPGTYYCTAINGMDLETYYADQASGFGWDLDKYLEEYELVGLDLGEANRMILHEDGTAEMYNNGRYTGYELTWSFDGSTLTVTDGVYPVPATWSDGAFTLEAGSLAMSYVKQP